MCYSVSNTKVDKVVLHFNTRKFKPGDLFSEPAVFVSGFTHPNLAIIKEGDSEYISSGKWGLVPSFIKDGKRAKEISEMTLNAKAETIFEKPSFRNSIMPRRCLIPVTGFFEWMDLNKKKYPYFISLKNEDIFSLGGIYDSWVDISTGELTTTFAIITTEANPLMAKIHNLKKRMPLIVPKDQEAEWLDPNKNESEIMALMKPVDENIMQAHTIRKMNPRAADHNDPKILEHIEYPELNLIE